MLKSIFLLSLALPLGITFNQEPKSLATNNSDYFIVEQNERDNYTITGVTDRAKNYSELRIYNDESGLIDEIADNAFESCAYLKTLMLSSSVKYVESTTISNIERINYTGSKEEFQSLSLTYTGIVKYYACDEGFMNYWNSSVRPTEDISICDMSKEEFDVVYDLYKNLSKKDRDAVDKEEDIAGESISSSMKELMDMFIKKNPSSRKDELTQDNAIGVIIVIALIGMTSICVFYLLKTKDVIS